MYKTFVYGLLAHYSARSMKKMWKVLPLNLNMFIFGVFSVAGFLSLLLLRFILTKRPPCYIPASLQADPVYVLTACRLPDDVRLWPSIGNGHISMVVHSENIFMNGLYSGYMNRSHRAAIPSPLSANVTYINNEARMNRSYVLNTKTGVFQEIIYIPGANVTLEWYAHRTLLPLLVFEVTVQRQTAAEYPLHVSMDLNQWADSHDLDFLPLSAISHNISVRHGITKEAETSTSERQPVFIIFNDIHPVLSVGASELYHHWSFLASIHVNLSTANRTFFKGLQLSNSGELRRLHTEAWAAVWHRGTIEVSGDLHLARITSASQYYIFSSVPDADDSQWPFVGLSPCGLAWGDDQNYFGHVFWDQETWMYPPLLLMHAEWSRRFIATRFRTLYAARQNAEETGYRGVRYPWESAFTGVETTESEICAEQEIHINGDISFAMQQYLLATGDMEIVKTPSYQAVVFGIAAFWISRLQYNETRQLFDINVVQSPDEYAFNVNNSAFTNMVAIQSLLFAADVAQMCERPVLVETYMYYAKRIYIPFDASVGFHPEYDGYITGTTIKQADVILLGFPFMWNMTDAVRLKDLQMYDAVTSVKGPAMSDSMYAIGWLELKEPDRAYRDFQKMFDHVAGDFQVWTENKKKGGATNFITGMGGFLQALLFGYGGVRLQKSSLDFDPELPPGCLEMRFIGIDYMNSSLSVTILPSNMTITVTAAGSFPLRLHTAAGSTDLILNHTVTVNRTRAYITAIR